jgi:hypothetical protein
VSTTLISFLLSPTTYGKPGGLYIHGPLIVVFVELILLLYFLVGSLAWLWQDARKRNKSAWVAVVFVLCTGWPLSFLWWLWLRPQIAETASGSGSSPA